MFVLKESANLRVEAGEIRVDQIYNVADFKTAALSDKSMIRSEVNMNLLTLE